MIEEIPTIGFAMTTAADWGQLAQFDGSGAAELIVPPRAYYFRDFFMGSWNDLSIGFIHAECGISAETAAIEDERQLENNLANLFQFGISQSKNGAIDIVNNPFFTGLCGLFGGITQITASTNTLGQLVGTLIDNNGQGTTNGNLFQMDLSQGVTSTPFSMLGIRFIFDPIKEILSMNFQSQTNVGIGMGDDPSPILETFLQGLSGDTTNPSASFLLPNNSNFETFFLYWPYLNNQIKLQCVGAIKNS